MIDNELFTQLRNVASKFIPAKDLDDLTQLVFEQLLSKPDQLQQLIKDKKIKYYFIRLCKNNYYSKTSRYYYKYDKAYKHISFNTDVMLKISKQKAQDLYFIQDSDIINTILDNLYWYDRELFRLYVLGDDDGNKFTYTSLSKKTKISRMNIYLTIKKVKEYLKAELKKRHNDI